MDNKELLKSGIELGYSARNSRHKADTIDYVFKIYDSETTEDTVVSTYESLMDEMGKILRKELNINLTDIHNFSEDILVEAEWQEQIAEEEVEDAADSEDNDEDGSTDDPTVEVLTGSDEVSSSGDDVLSGDTDVEEVPIQSLPDGGPSESDDGSAKSNDTVQRSGAATSGSSDGDKPKPKERKRAAPTSVPKG